MLSKKVIKDIQSLSHKKNRDDAGLFIAEGPKIVSELIQLIPDRIEHIYATESWQPAVTIDGIKTETVAAQELQKISALQTPNEVLAVIRQQKSPAPPVMGIILYLDTVQDPGNLGTIIRTCDWFGLRHLVCSPGCADHYNLKVVQATMASIARVQVYTDADGSWLAAQQAPVWAAALEGKPLSSFRKGQSGILVIGNESKGISAEVMQYATEKLTIPRIGEAESLNAAVAAGIILSHLIS